LRKPKLIKSCRAEEEEEKKYKWYHIPTVFTAATKEIMADYLF
jgi:hypothetical protein